jgi:dGTPase
VVDKEIAGYKIISTLLEAYTVALENAQHGVDRHYDHLILKELDYKVVRNSSVYDYLMKACNHISQLTDGRAVQIYEKINGNLG